MIAFQSVHKHFLSGGKEVTALDGINLDIPKGDIFGVIGFSGAGKSTLLRMVNALEVPDRGHVVVDGRAIDTLSHEELRRMRKKIGMVFQQFHLLESKTVRENIAIPLRLAHDRTQAEIDARVEELLAFVELEDKAAAFPWQLSGGQKQRVGIARALATQPSILLCDEATSALDPETTDSILKLLDRINREFGITILFVTHQIQVIQKLCRHVAVMEGGRVVESGRTLDVFSSPKEDITRRFVRAVIPDRLPESLVKSLLEETRSHRLLRLRFLGENAKESLLYQIHRKFPVESSVLFASVSEIEKTILGIFIVDFVGEEDALLAVQAYIEEQGVFFEEVHL